MKERELRNLIREEVKKALNEVASTTDGETIKTNLQQKKDGVYILQGGLLKSGRWSFASLDKAKPLFYTPDFRDPELKSFQEDGMIKVDMDKGNIGVSIY